MKLKAGEEGNACEVGKEGRGERLGQQRRPLPGLGVQSQSLGVAGAEERAECEREAGARQGTGARPWP